MHYEIDWDPTACCSTCSNQTASRHHHQYKSNGSSRCGKTSGWQDSEWYIVRNEDAITHANHHGTRTESYPWWDTLPKRRSITGWTHSAASSCHWIIPGYWCQWWNYKACSQGAQGKIQASATWLGVPKMQHAFSIQIVAHLEYDDRTMCNEVLEACWCWLLQEWASTIGRIPTFDLEVWWFGSTTGHMATAYDGVRL